MSKPLTVEELRQRREERTHPEQGEARKEPAKLRLGGSSRFDIDRRPWPTLPDLIVGIRPLMDGEVADAEVEAAAAVQHLPGEIGVKGTLRDKEYGFAIQAAVLCRALVDPEKPTVTTWPSMAALRRDALREELNTVAVWYADHQKRVYPLQRTADEAFFRQTWELVKKTREPTWLDHFDASTLRDFAHTLALKLDSWETSTSSGSTNDGSSESGTPSTETASAPPEVTAAP